MRKSVKLSSAILLAALTLILFPPATALSVGVKKGDWIEYHVAVTGTMPDHDAQWARTDVVDVQGAVLHLKMTTQFVNGTYLYENITLNLKTGQLGDDFFIPANMSSGDSFFDARVGNINITGFEQRIYAGAERSVLAGHTDVTSFYWDQKTGILVEAYSNYPTINFTMHTVAVGTNIWPPMQTQLNLTLETIVAGAFLSVAVFLVLVRWLARSSARKATK